MHKHRAVWLCLLLGGIAASGHLCNNIYRTPDRLIVKPEKQAVVLDQADEFRVFVQNNYHTYVHNVRLSVTAEGAQGVQVQVEPESVRELKAGERVSFNVRLTAGAGAAKGQKALRFGIQASEVGFRPVQEPSVNELVEAAGNGNHSPAVMAAESLVRRGDPRGMEKLKSFASRDNPDYRGRAIRAIGKAGDRTAIPFLKDLLAERNGWVRGNALLALGLLKEDVNTFVPYQQDRDEFVRAAAVGGQCLAGDHRQAVLDWLKSNLRAENVYVRIACGWALAAQRDRDGIAALDQAFTTNDPQQRTTAGDAMVDVASRAQ